jgi:Zn finger protein HypA/HybF involved in hydrogenase expression
MILCPECFTEYPDGIDYCHVCKKKIEPVLLRFVCEGCDMHFLEYFSNQIRCPKCGGGKVRIRGSMPFEHRLSEYLKNLGVER